MNNCTLEWVSDSHRERHREVWLRRNWRRRLSERSDLVSDRLEWQFGNFFGRKWSIWLSSWVRNSSCPYHHESSINIFLIENIWKCAHFPSTIVLHMRLSPNCAFIPKSEGPASDSNDRPNSSSADLCNNFFRKCFSYFSRTWAALAKMWKLHLLRPRASWITEWLSLLEKNLAEPKLMPI